jgi:hypothetical protein
MWQAIMLQAISNATTLVAGFAMRVRQVNCGAESES